MSLHESFDDLDIALYHLIFIGNSLDKSFIAFSNILDKVETEHERALFITTASLMLIQTVSFLDEYHHHIKSSNSELNSFVKNIKKAVKPAIDEIEAWKGIDDFRNHVLAHNLRNQKKKVSVFEYGFESYDIPQHGGELAVLHQCISMITRTFESAFNAKLESIQKALDQNSRVVKRNKYKSVEEANAATARIMNEINVNILQLKIDAGIP